jgi:hypothetical protein
MNPLSLRIAIPNHNGARHLVQTLRSLNEQNSSVNWWLQDDQSCDESLELARALARPDDTISCEHDSGTADALNKAISRMGGDIVGFLPPGDYLLPGAAHRILEEFQDNPGTDVVASPVRCIDARGQFLQLHRTRVRSLQEILDIYRVWSKGRRLVPAGVFWRRSLWDKVGPFNIHYNLSFDYHFWVRCFRTGIRIQTLSIPLSATRANPSSLPIPQADEIRTIVQHTLKSHPRIGPFFLWQLQNRLSYDRFLSGQDTPPNQLPPPLHQQLSLHPRWLLIPSFRRQLYGALRRRFFGSSLSQSNTSLHP